MRIDSILVVCTEWLAFSAWLFNYSKLTERKYKLLTLYLGIVAIVELLNLLLNTGDNSWSNILVMQVVMPLEFVFFINFLLYDISTKHQVASILFTILFLVVFILERLNFFPPPVYFDSVSYGSGTLLLIVSIIILLLEIFKKENTIPYNQTPIFWILTGLMLFYIGTLPYNNFRNFYWPKPTFHKLASFLHYLTQTICCILYLLFAYSVKWKIK